MSERTEWYEPTMDPYRVGVYERLYDGHAVRFCLFDGYAWHAWAFNTRDAYLEPEISDLKLPWRGLAKPEHGEG